MEQKLCLLRTLIQLLQASLENIRFLTMIRLVTHSAYVSQFPQVGFLQVQSCGIGLTEMAKCTAVLTACFIGDSTSQGWLLGGYDGWSPCDRKYTRTIPDGNWSSVSLKWDVNPKNNRRVIEHEYQNIRGRLNKVIEFQCNI